MGSPQGCRGSQRCVPHMRETLDAARSRASASSTRCITGTAPATTRPGSISHRFRRAAWSRKTFEYGTWGGELHPEFEPQPGDIVAQEHWCSSGFANTDFDLQLKKHGIHRLIVIGLIAHTCVEATVRFGAELGYDVTVVKDATASYSDDEMHAALDVNIPNYASAIVTTSELLESISSGSRQRVRIVGPCSPLIRSRASQDSSGRPSS